MVFSLKHSIRLISLTAAAVVFGKGFDVGPILNDSAVFDGDNDVASTFKMGTPTFFGSGCPSDSVRVITSTDGQSVSVLFSDYIAATSGKKTRSRKSCNLAVPVDVKQGVSIGIFRVDYRGYGYVPANSKSKARFSAEYYFAGMQGPTSRRTYRSGFDDDLFISNQVPVSSIVWSPCGASTNFRINTAITASKRSSRDEDVEIAIDSTDVTVDKSQLFQYFFTFRRC